MLHLPTWAPRARLVRASAFALALLGSTAVSISAQSGDTQVHVANRAGFGPSPRTVAAIGTTLASAAAYIDRQLDAAPTNPDRHVDPSLPASTSPAPEIAAATSSLALPTQQGDPGTAYQITQAQIAYATYSDWQLRELMAQFWDRHFNTHLFAQSIYFKTLAEAQGVVNFDQQDAYAAWFEFAASQHYRGHAFDTFASLLQFMAQDPAMVIYLHLTANVKGTPNEDFARELPELYAMGPARTVLDPITGLPLVPLRVVDNYTQPDIIEIARIFTGWTVDRDPVTGDFAFAFDASKHDTQLKTVFGQSYGPDNGVQEGLDFLGDLANRPETAQFICTKLVREFLGDDADTTPAGAAVLVQAIGAWGSNGGNIKEVLRTILTSAPFLDGALHPEFRRNRARIPFKQVVAPMRALQATSDTGATPNLTMFGPWLAMGLLGQDLFGYPAPDGYPSESTEQISSSATSVRIRTVHGLLLASPSLPGYVPEFDALLPQFQTMGFHTWNYSGWVLESLYGPAFTLADQQAVFGVLTDVQNAGFGADVFVLAAAIAAGSLTQSGIE